MKINVFKFGRRVMATIYAPLIATSVWLQWDDMRVDVMREHLTRDAAVTKIGHHACEGGRIKIDSFETRVAGVLPIRVTHCAPEGLYAVNHYGENYYTPQVNTSVIAYAALGQLFKTDGPNKGKQEFLFWAVIGFVAAQSVVGWIMRGLLDVPTGQDYRKEKRS